MTVKSRLLEILEKEKGETLSGEKRSFTVPGLQSGKL